MIEPDRFLAALREHGVVYCTGVPDSLLGAFCARLENPPRWCTHVMAANEGGAVGLAIGHHLATGQTPLVYMQNSGLGNAINPLLSLADPDVYSIPMLLLIGWRGEPGRADEPQHLKTGRVMNAMLDAMEIPRVVLENNPQSLHDDLGAAVTMAHHLSAPVAVIVRRGLFATASSVPADDGTLSRQDAIHHVLDVVDDNDAVVGTTGMISRELYALRDIRGERHDRDFLTVGGMGHAAQIAFAIAAAAPDRRVWCLDGDGALLMHLGGLSVNARRPMSNLRHLVLNNAAHDSVGGMATAAGHMVLPDIARAAGYHAPAAVSGGTELAAALQRLRDHNGPGFQEIRVRRGHTPGLGRPKPSPAENKRALMRHLGR